MAIKLTQPVNPGPALWKQFAIVPVVLGLISTSLIFGYANGALQRRSSSSDNSTQFTQTADLKPVAPEKPEILKNRGVGDEVYDTASSQTPDPLDNYKTTLALLKKNYYGTVIDKRVAQQLTYEAIRGMLLSLHDQFTSFLDPDDWSQMRATTEGDFEGVGALLEPDGTHVKVSRPIETSPAEAVGMKTDDVIVSVDGISVKGLNVNEIVHKIKGKSGTKVRLGVERGKTQLDFNIVRALVEPPVAQRWMEDDENKIGHIVLSEFNEKSMAQLRKAYEELEKQGMKALVFDLRENPGGLLDTAIDVASVFIPPDENQELKNTVVYIHEGSGKERGIKLRQQDFSAHRMPIVVLVNKNTASASEIVSGAMKDYGIATIMGERTYGKGKVQTLYPLDDGSALRLTTALYFPPRHYDINFERDEDGFKREGTGGILPDIDVKQSDRWRVEDFKDKVHDSQLRSALQFLRARLNGKSLSEAKEGIVSNR